MSDHRLQRNALLHALDGVFFFASITLFNRGQVVPRMIADLSDSGLLLGLVAFVFWLGQLVPQVFAARMLEGLAYKKRAVLIWAAIQRVGYAAFLASLFLFWKPAPTLSLYFMALAINRLATGVIGPLWSDFYAKTSPSGAWASVLGVRRALSGLVGVVLGLFIRWVMGSYPPPTRYQVLLAPAVACMAASLVCVALIQEERRDGLPHHRDRPWRAYFGGLAGILLAPGPFRRFLIGSVALGLPMTLIVTFLTRYGLTHPGVSDGITGTFTAFYQGSMAVGSLAGGYLSDRRNVIAPFRLAPALFVAAAVIVVFTSSPIAVSVAWTFLGLAFGMRLTSFLPAIMRFAEPNRIPSYIALSLTFVGVPRAICPPLAGWFIDIGLLTFRQLFAGCAVLAFIAWALFFCVQAPSNG